MRIPEKTIELNFCRGFLNNSGHDIIWFGLTQKQEAKAGFDACARLGSKLILFQIKASNKVLKKNGARRFLAEHNQMQTLRNQVKNNRLIYYVLPIVGNTLEPCSGLCFSSCSLYLDVAMLPTVIPPPNAKGKIPIKLRKNNCHYIDSHPDRMKAVIHSEPFEIKLLSADDLERKLAEYFQPQKKTLKDDDTVHDFDEFWNSLSMVDRRNLVGAYAIR